MMLDPQKIHTDLAASLPAYGRVEYKGFAHTRNSDGSINLIRYSNAILLLTEEKITVNVGSYMHTSSFNHIPHMYRPLEVFSVRKQKNSPPLVRLKVGKDVFTVPVGGTVEITRSGTTCTHWKARTPNRQRARVALKEVTDFFTRAVLTSKLSGGTDGHRWYSSRDVIEAIAEGSSPIDALGWAPLSCLTYRASAQGPDMSMEDIALLSKRFVANNQYELFGRLGVYEPDS